MKSTRIQKNRFVEILKKVKSYKLKKSKNKFASACDFIGIANTEGRKIDINKEIEDAWINLYPSISVDGRSFI